MKDENQRPPDEKGCKKGNFVEIIDDHVEVFMPEMREIPKRDIEAEEKPPTFSDYIDAIDRFPAGRAVEGRAKERHIMSSPCDTGKNLVHMHLCAAAERIFDVLPVKNEDFHLLPLGTGVGQKLSRSEEMEGSASVWHKSYCTFAVSLAVPAIFCSYDWILDLISGVLG